jgi:3-oxoacyl-[acyl-carrier-protein] synthase-3
MNELGNSSASSDQTQGDLMRAAVTGIGHYVPSDVLDNEHFAMNLATSGEWIVARTGIERRHVLRSGATSDLIVPAALDCLRQRRLAAEDLDCILVATLTPDYSFPATASIVQAKLGARRAWGFDISAACCGFLMALITAARFVETGAADSVLVCGGDRMSAITDYEDRSSAILFGDGAGVVLVEKSNFSEIGILDHIAWMDGSQAQQLYMPAGGSACPTSAETVAARQHYLAQDGPAVFRAAVSNMTQAAREVMDRNHLTAEDVRWFVPHQANKRIIDAVGARLQIAPERVMSNIACHGNTCAATIPLALSQWHQNSAIAIGDKILLTAFGAGFTTASVYLRWALTPPSSSGSEYECSAIAVTAAH